VTPFVMLAEHYQTSQEHQKRDLWKNFALKLVQQSGDLKVLEYIQDKF